MHAHPTIIQPSRSWGYRSRRPYHPPCTTGSPHRLPRASRHQIPRRDGSPTADREIMVVPLWILKHSSPTVDIEIMVFQLWIKKLWQSHSGYWYHSSPTLDIDIMLCPTG